MGPKPSSRSSAVDVWGPGSGIPLLLCHGTGLNRTMWTPIREQLPARVQAIAPDLPGHGGRADQRFEVESAAATVLADLDARTDDDAVVVGHTAGGYAALEVARREPDRVASMVLSGASVAYRGVLGIRARLSSALVRLVGSVEPIDALARRRTARRLRALGLPGEVGGGASLRAGASASRALVGYPTHEVIADLECPVVLVDGGDDGRNVEAAARLASEHDHVRAETVDGAGRMLPLERPRAFAATVRSAIDARQR